MAFKEIARTLKAGGMHIFTVPLVNKESPTQITPQAGVDGQIIHLIDPPEYHGNPISEKGSLVTRRWGVDIIDFIRTISGMDTEMVTLDDLHYGIRAEYIEVLVSRK